MYIVVNAIFTYKKKTYILLSKHTVDVDGISKTLHEFQFKQESLAPIIWILIYFLRPEIVRIEENLEYQFL